MMDEALLKARLNMRKAQVVKSSFGTKDSRFPVFKIPVNETLLVYVPKFNVQTLPDGTEYLDVVPSASHDCRNGSTFSKITCIKGIPENDPVAIHLGWAGKKCPACEAVNECWELINLKMAEIGRQMLIDPQNDVEGRLKPQREQFRREMAVDKVKEYVTFPIVVIPHKKLRPTEDAMDTMQAYFVTMSASQYNEKVQKDLGTMLNNPGHIGGRFMIWQYVYDSQGKQPNAMDAARNASFSIVTDADALAIYMPYRDKAEEIAKPFTNDVAQDVLTALETPTYDELVMSVNRVMKSTRANLMASEVGAVPTSAQQTLEAFGASVVSNGTPALEGGAQSQTVESVHRFG